MCGVGYQASGAGNQGSPSGDPLKVRLSFCGTRNLSRRSVMVEIQARGARRFWLTCVGTVSQSSLFPTVSRSTVPRCVLVQISPIIQLALTTQLPV